MSIQVQDLIFRKALRATDTGLNGGARSRQAVIPGARHNLFPRVSRVEREAGIIRHRKQFFCNENPQNETAHGVLLFLEFPSCAEDRFALALGTQSDTQQELLARSPAWLGVGQLAAPLAGGEMEVSLVMEGTDTVLENGGFLHLSNRFQTQQTLAADVNPGDSVRFDGQAWRGVDPTDDVRHPAGMYLGAHAVLTATDQSREEWLRLADLLRADETLGQGDGASVQPPLAPLALAGAGVCLAPGKLPELRAVCGGQSRTVRVAADGLCAGYCVAGRLHMETGQWLVPLAWTTPPDAGTDIVATYRERCFTRSGATLTARLAEPVAGAYAMANTFGGGCVFAEELAAGHDGWLAVSPGGGSYNHAVHPPLLPLQGVEEETWTLTFTSATTFSCAGARVGQAGSGTVTAPFAPMHPEAGVPYFSLSPSGFVGVFQAGDVLRFQTHPAALPLWVRQTVDQGVPQAAHSLAVIGWYCE